MAPLRASALISFTLLCTISHAALPDADKFEKVDTKAVQDIFPSTMASASSADDCDVCEAIGGRRRTGKKQKRYKCYLMCGKKLKFDGGNLALGDRTDEFAWLGISELRLERTTGFKSHVFDYRYLVKNSRPLLLLLHDIEPDTYTLSCVNEDWHEVKFNSKKDPKLVSFHVVWLSDKHITSHSEGEVSDLVQV